MLNFLWESPTLRLFVHPTTTTLLLIFGMATLAPDGLDFTLTRYTIPGLVFVIASLASTMIYAHRPYRFFRELRFFLNSGLLGLVAVFWSDMISQMVG